MTLDRKNFIHSMGDGRLGDTTVENLATLVDAISLSKKVVLHIHGGLASKEDAMKSAERLRDEYAPIAHPVFLIWESGLLEIIRNNLSEIFDEKIFERISSEIVRWVVGKLQTEKQGIKAVSGQLQLPNETSHAIQMQKVQSNLPATASSEPYDDFDLPVPLHEVGDVTDDEMRALQQELGNDSAFIEEVEAVLAGLKFEGVDEFKNARPHVEPAKTLMSKDILEELSGVGTFETKGLMSTATLAVKAGKIFGRVIRRFLRGRDHGVYVTTVEEILRELYVANVGARAWSLMKKETSDTFFATPGERRAGDLLLRSIGRLANEGKRPRITLIGHSAGAVFINNLLIAADQARSDPTHPMPKDFSFGDVVFLAPACSFTQFAEVIGSHRSVFEEFRMFTMDEVHEIKDPLVPAVPAVYPRSLLYFISGVLEYEEGGQGASDLPILGMDRYYHRLIDKKDPFASIDSVSVVRNFVLGSPQRVVWSVTPDDAPVGLRSDAISHGGFDGSESGVPRATIDSIRQLIQHGWNDES